ncbi:MAG: hypothetical protein ACYDCO_27155, partial [Armatimonadota bacterium]
TNHAPITRPRFGNIEIPTQAFSILNGSESRDRFDDYLDGGPGGGGTVSNVALSDALRGMLLTHNAPEDGRDMTTTMVTSATGLDVCLPQGMRKLHLVSYNNVADTPTSYTSVGALPASPCFSFTFTRAFKPPTGMDAANQAWRLTFGGRYTLEWSRTAPARLIRDYGLGTEKVIAIRPRQDLKGDYGTRQQFTLTVYNLLGKLFLYSDLWGGEWTITLLDDAGKAGVEMPQAAWTMACTGGKYAWNVSPLTFATSGYIETDWIPIPEGASYPDAPYDADTQPDGVVCRTFPTRQPAGTSVSLAVIESGVDDFGAPQKRFRLTMTSDGTVSPTIYAFEYRWLDMYGAAVSNLLDITPWVPQATETKPGDNSPHSLAMTLKPGEVHNGQTLWQALTAAGMGTLQGEYAVSYATGVGYGDGTPATSQERMLGYLDVTGKKIAVGKLDSLPCTAYDRWARLAKGSLQYPPACAGLRVDEAIALIARCGGVPPNEIDAEVIGFTLDTPEPFTDHYEFTGALPWTPPANGTAADFIRQLAEAYGVAVWFNGAGRMQIQLKALPTAATVPVASYDMQAGATLEEALTTLDDTADRGPVVNRIVVEGVGPNGRPLYAWEDDQASLSTPDTPRYLGFLAVEWRVMPDVMSYGTAVTICRRLFHWRPGAQPYTLTSDTADLGARWPHQVVDATDKDGTDHRLYLVTVSNELTPTRNKPTLTGEAR